MRGVMERFWTLLETNFPLGGPRRHLSDLLGVDAAVLEQAGVLRCTRVADEYPCDHARSDGCPRRVVETTRGIVGVCGNHPPECDDLPLSARDIEQLAFRVDTLCGWLTNALGLRPPGFEELAALHAAYRVGTHHPEPGIKHPVYFLVRCREREYAEAIDALYTHAGEPFALAVPTERFIGDELRRRVAAMGIVFLSLAEWVGTAKGQLQLHGDPSQLLAAIGHRPTNVLVSNPVVANALVKSAGTDSAQWRELGHAAYEALREAESGYDIVADALRRTVIKGGRRETKVRPTWFQIIERAARARAPFDPSSAEDLVADPVPLFQRARKMIDIGERKSWKLFKNVEVGGKTLYQWRPEVSVSFALIFVPPPPSVP